MSVARIVWLSWASQSAHSCRPGFRKVSRLIGSSLLSGAEHPSPLAVCRHLNRSLISSKRCDIQARKFPRPENRSMRKSKAETAKTRERILEAASAEFLSHGITEAGLAQLMRAAGLTHGGFYRHFASKDQLVAEACSQAVQSLASGLKSQIAGKPPD